MRPYAIVSIAALALLAACNSERAQNSATASPSSSPAPLRSCETRELNLDGADLVLHANVDRSVASITVVHAQDDAARSRALEHASKIFGEPHRDTRTATHPNKWGLVQITDMCGQIVSPVPSGAATLSP